MDQIHYHSFVLFVCWSGSDLHVKRKKKKKGNSSSTWLSLVPKPNEGQTIIKEESRSYPRMLTQWRRAGRPAATSDVWLYKGLISVSVSHLYVVSEAFVVLFRSINFGTLLSRCRLIQFYIVAEVQLHRGLEVLRRMCDCRAAAATSFTQSNWVHVQLRVQFLMEARFEFLHLSSVWSQSTWNVLSHEMWDGNSLLKSVSRVCDM